jgi:hypothetical protein
MSVAFVSVWGSPPPPSSAFVTLRELRVDRRRPDQNWCGSVSGNSSPSCIYNSLSLLFLDYVSGTECLCSVFTCSSSCRSVLYIRYFVSARFIIVITQFQVTIATDCRALPRCMNISYAVCHERTSSLLFQCIVSTVSVSMVFELVM